MESFALFVVIILIGIFTNAGHIKKSRYGSNSCSLTSKSGCDFISSLNIVSNTSSLKALFPLRFGEIACNVTLQDCVVGECYLIVDATQSIAQDSEVNRSLPSSVFRMFLSLALLSLGHREFVKSLLLFINLSLVTFTQKRN